MGLQIIGNRSGTGGLDTGEHIIVRGDDLAGVSPTVGEVPTPLNGDTATVILTGGNQELWTYASGSWGLTFTVVASSVSAASTTAQGIVELATEAEAFAGISSVLVTPVAVTTTLLEANRIQVITADPTDGVTAALFQGQLFWNRSGKTLFEALTASDNYPVATGSTFAEITLAGGAGSNNLFEADDTTTEARTHTVDHTLTFQGTAPKIFISDNGASVVNQVEVNTSHAQLTGTNGTATATIRALPNGDIHLISSTGIVRLNTPPPIDSDGADRIAVLNTSGVFRQMEKDALRVLWGVSDPIDGTTVAHYEGQLYINTSTREVFRATTKSSDPDSNGSSSVWSNLDVTNHDRRFLSDTLVSPATAGEPTLTEIETVSSSTPSRIVYYTGNDTPTDDPTYVWAIDASGNATTLRSPAIVVEAANAISPASNDNIGAIGVSVRYARQDHKHPTQDVSGSGGQLLGTDANGLALLVAADLISTDSNNGITPGTDNRLFVNGQIGGQFLGSATTFAALPVVDSEGDPASNGDFAILTQDDGGNTSGLYVYNGSAFVFVMEIADSFAAASSVIPPESDDNVGAIGASADYARADHKHPAQTVSAQAQNALVEGSDNLHYARLANTSDITGNVIRALLDATVVIDEDDMNTNSNSRLPTQQSVKRYVDTQRLQIISAAPVNGVTTAYYLGQLFWDETNEKLYTATAASTDPYTAATGSTFNEIPLNEASSYQAAFVAGDWVAGAGSTKTLTITAATHGLGTGVLFDVIVADSSQTINEVTTTVDFSGTGDVTLTTTGATFDGTIRIKK